MEYGSGLVAQTTCREMREEILITKFEESGTFYSHNGGSYVASHNGGSYFTSPFLACEKCGQNFVHKRVKNRSAAPECTE